MSNTLERLKDVSQTQSTQPKPTASKNADLQLVAERLALIEGHISNLPQNICISGVTIMDGFLLVALKIPNHILDISVSGAWLLDKQAMIDYATNKEDCKDE
jgi:hypothetical protein